MSGIKRKKCCNCDELFIPDPRNTTRQRYCSKPECRKASKAASQRRWLASAFSCGGRTTRATGAASVKLPKMRYKIP